MYKHVHTMFGCTNGCIFTVQDKTIFFKQKINKDLTLLSTNIHIKRKEKKKIIIIIKSHVQGSGQTFSVINLIINTYKNKEIRHTQQKLLYSPTGIHIQGKNHSKK